MSVRNIDKGFYKVTGGGGSTDIPPTNYNLGWSGAFTATTKAIFSKSNGIVNVHMNPVMGTAVVNDYIQCQIPEQFKPTSISGTSYPVFVNISNSNIIIGTLFISFPMPSYPVFRISSTPTGSVQNFTVGDTVGIQFQFNFSYLAD